MSNLVTVVEHDDLAMGRTMMHSKLIWSDPMYDAYDPEVFGVLAERLEKFGNEGVLIPVLHGGSLGLVVPNLDGVK